MDKCDDPAGIRLCNVIDMGLNFSAMLRLYSPGSKKNLHERIHSASKQLFEAESQEAFTRFHSSICGWGIGNILLRNREAFASYGQIAKTLDVVLKVVIYYCHLPDCESSTRLSRWLNAAVDTRMMAMLRRCYPDAIKPFPVAVQEVNSRDRYEAIQGLVRRYITEKHPGILPVQFDDIYWWKLNKRRVYCHD
jgi:hypothetical protein